MGVTVQEGTDLQQPSGGGDWGGATSPGHRMADRDAASSCIAPVRAGHQICNEIFKSILNWQI